MKKKILLIMKILLESVLIVIFKMNNSIERLSITFDLIITKNSWTLKIHFKKTILLYKIYWSMMNAILYNYSTTSQNCRYELIGDVIQIFILRKSNT